MNITIRHDAFDRTVLALHGRLDFVSAETLVGPLTRAATHARALALDLSGLDFLSAWGAQMILAAARKTFDRHCPFLVVAGTEQAAYALRMAGMDTMMPIYKILTEETWTLAGYPRRLMFFSRGVSCPIPHDSERVRETVSSRVG